MVTCCPARHHVDRALDQTLPGGIYSSAMMKLCDAVQWPDLFDTDEARQQQERVVEGMRVVRPVVETGCVSWRD